MNWKQERIVFNNKLEALRAYGVEPDLEKAKRDPKTIKNFLELHIEQGPVLDRENIEVGLIKYLAGIGRYTIKFYGKTAGITELMSKRKDALVGASYFIEKFNKVMNTFGDEATRNSWTITNCSKL